MAEIFNNLKYLIDIEKEACIKSNVSVVVLTFI